MSVVPLARDIRGRRQLIYQRGQSFCCAQLLLLLFYCQTVKMVVEPPTGKELETMSKRAKRHQPPEFVQAAVGRRASGAAGPHSDRRTKRIRTRNDARRAAIHASQQQ